jgi:hypothetical protein
MNQDEFQADTPSDSQPAEGTGSPDSTPEVKKESKPRLPKLTLTYNGEEQPLLKYPFPVKAARYSVRINGHQAEAATTAGRGKAYTYLLFQNTSFYVPGVIPPDSDLTVNFPEGYRFDEAVIARVSTYKPKKAKEPKAKAEPKAEGEAAAEAPQEGAPAVQGDGTDPEPAVSEAVAEAPRAKRRR